MSAANRQLIGVFMPEVTLIEKNKVIYRRFIQEIFNEGRLDRLSELVSSTYILQDAPKGTPSGQEAIKQIVTMFRTAFPDLKITIERLIGEGEMLAAKSVMQGTHQQTIFGIAGTGRVINMSSLTMVRITDGKLQESWVRNDLLGLMNQLDPSRKGLV